MENRKTVFQSPKEHMVVDGHHPEYPWIGLRENQTQSEPETMVGFTTFTIQIYTYGVCGKFSLQHPSTRFILREELSNCVFSPPSTYMKKSQRFNGLVLLGTS